MITLLAGFLAGFIHVLAGPDHVAAVAPLAARGRAHAWRHGYRWGLGHAAGVVFVTILALLFREMLPLEAISGWSERLVGVLLIALGAWTLRKALQIHSHEHMHGGHAHEHIHMHARSAAHVHPHAAFGIGTLHGLAGSSHLLGVIPALALPSSGLAVGYLLAFGAGTIVAMAAFASLVGAIASRFAVRSWLAWRGLMYACSAAAFLVGSAWLFF